MSYYAMCDGCGSNCHSDDVRKHMPWLMERYDDDGGSWGQRPKRSYQLCDGCAERFLKTVPESLTKMMEARHERADAAVAQNSKE